MRVEIGPNGDARLIAEYGPEVKKHLEGKVGREAYEALWEMVRDEVSQAALYAQLEAESEGENRAVAGVGE